MRFKVKNVHETICNIEIEGGSIFLDPGEEVTAEMTEDQCAAARASGWFDIDDVV